MIVSPTQKPANMGLHKELFKKDIKIFIKHLLKLLKEFSESRPMATQWLDAVKEPSKCVITITNGAAWSIEF